MSPVLTAEGIRELIPRVLPVVNEHARRTPWLRSSWLSDRVRGDVYLKCENLQITGSFKLRGALAALSLMSPEDRARGVVTSSTGNHGSALTYAAAVFGVTCTVVVPGGAAPVKVARMREGGARVVQAPHHGYDLTQTWTLEHLGELGGTFVSPFEAAAVIAGNGGTTAVEIDEQAGELDTVVVPAGGLGLISGLAVELEARRPGLNIVGVNGEACPGLLRSRADGRPVLEIESGSTLADGIEGGVGAETFALADPRISDVVVVSEATIAEAVGEVARRDKLVIEGAAAVAVAAVLEGKIAARRIGLVLSGGNIGPDVLGRILGDTAP